MGSPATLPADFNGWDKPPDTLPADFDKWDAANSQQEQPGFFRRFGQSLGIPTSKEELESAVTPVMVHGIPVAPKMSGLGAVAGYAGNVYDKARELLAHPELGPALKAVMSLTPVGGSQQSFGEDVAAGNYAGAAGTAAGIGTQAVLPEAIERAGAIKVDPYSVPARAARTARSLAIDAAKDIPVVRTLSKTGEAWKSTAPPVEPAAETPRVVRQAGSLAQGPRTYVDPAAGLGQVPITKPAATPVAPEPAVSNLGDLTNFPTAESRAASDRAFARMNPNEAMPEGMTPQEKEIWQERLFGEKPTGDIGSKVRAANPEPTRAEVKAAQNKQTGQLSDLLDQSLGVKKPIPGVKLKNQPAAQAAAESAVPEGHTPVESSAIRSFKYDPSAKEFHAATRSGNTIYVYGDVGPEEATQFANAESKGKAWQQIRNNPLIAKIVDGKRIPIKPARVSATPETTDLSDLLQKSVEAARARKSTEGTP